ncbi:Uncharacterized protein dnm_028600 [Desulfonema magnum]|uniref:Uncharacterized protein n=2 Tax=Desulfonema magnum TaxID=45655 RepID=A0A975BJY7_9BACT|nr:Uncharacterized protein dnm_028600 [Desulfonema magnum]
MVCLESAGISKNTFHKNNNSVLVPRLCLGTHTRGSASCINIRPMIQVNDAMRGSASYINIRPMIQVNDAMRGSASCINVRPMIQVNTMLCEAEPRGMRSQAEPGNE